ncbi:hypothetical protein T03_3636 [Trichinella britovi]|uniref:Uncharacterized protein n=1 Tax=Trichinella britovi TaxID=45882 RepID=A0A0V1CPX5_TRIBR|nr:hypothetical protein T03_3636 [Trichinella britovi]
MQNFTWLCGTESWRSVELSQRCYQCYTAWWWTKRYAHGDGKTAKRKRHESSARSRATATDQ